MSTATPDALPDSPEALEALEALRASSYFALVLTPEATHALLQRHQTLARPYGHHCTLVFGTDDPADLPPPFTAADLGGAFDLQVVGTARRADGGVEAVAVALLRDGEPPLTSGFSRNPVPHVTVATDGHTEPKASNALLEAGVTPVTGGLVLATTLQRLR